LLAPGETELEKRGNLMKNYSKPKQDGIATVLIVLLIGISLTAATVGTIHFVGSAQEKNMAFHARTMAQARAWGAADLIARHLDAVVDLDQAQNQWVQFYGRVRDREEGDDPDEEPSRDIDLGDLDRDVSARIVSVVGSQIDGVTLDVEIVSQVNPGTRAEATESLRLQYEVTPPSSEPGTGSSPPPYSGSLKGISIMGDLNYTGGGMDIYGGEVNLSGNLTISNGSAAGVRTCAKGDITVSGGGIKTGGSMLSEKRIRFSSMTAPTNATVWGRDVEIIQQNGTYLQIRSGAFIADVVSDGTRIGKAIVGGERVFNSASGTLSDAITLASAGHAWIVLDAGGDFVLDLSAFDGSNADAAALRASLEGTLPGALDFVFNAANTSFEFGEDADNRCGTAGSGGVCGGVMNVVNTTSGEVWGNAVRLGGPSTGQGNYSVLRSRETIHTGGRNIVVGSLLGGGDILPAALTNINQGTALLRPTLTSRIVGEVRMTTGTPWPNPIANLSRNIPGATPGLPGIPYCDVRPREVDVALFESSANLVFFLNDENRPQVKIQHMRFRNGDPVPEGPFDLWSQDVRRVPAVTGSPFLVCEWQTDPNNNGAHCFRTATRVSQANGWHLYGVVRFPPGIALFKGKGDFTGKLRIDGVNSTVRSNTNTLFNTFLAMDDVSLTTSGHGPLTAPNFGSVSDVCGGDIYPANICDFSGGTARFVSWTDQDGIERSGLPLANVAVSSDDGLDARGWTIRGAVVLGGAFSTGGSTTRVYGSVAVGGNDPDGVTITAGGVEIHLQDVTDDQLIIPWNPYPELGGGGGGGGGGEGPGEEIPGSVRLNWSGYR
jgi:hypothetical protein